VSVASSELFRFYPATFGSFIVHSLSRDRFAAASTNETLWFEKLGRYFYAAEMSIGLGWIRIITIFLGFGLDLDGGSFKKFTIGPDFGLR